MHIRIKKGLDIPISGKPCGFPKPLPKPKEIAFNLASFEEIGFRLQIANGQIVKIGQPLVENKDIPGQMFVSPAAGKVKEIRRGEKRHLKDIVIAVDEQESYFEHGCLSLEQITREELLSFFMRTGLFAHIRLRPFNLVPDPRLFPRSIFITASETRPFAPPYEMQINGYENDFQIGLKALSKMTMGKVHLVYPKDHPSSIFSEANDVEKHTISGPHPSGNSSIHIHKIDPIIRPDDYVWSLTALDVLIIGKMVSEGRYFTRRIISIAGSGLKEQQKGYYIARLGYPIKELALHKIASNQAVSLISGDPLTGSLVEEKDYLGFFHNCFSVILQNTKREPFHFFRLGRKKYSATPAYLSGHFANRPPSKKEYFFTTNQHGEQRAFIDPSVYEKVMPMRIPTVHLIKAILAEDFELADQLGLLEVVPEDFALSTFICPSKIDMVEIVKQGLRRYAKEMGH